MIAKTADGTIAVSGESVRPVAELIRVHGWRNAASMKLKFGMTSKSYPSVKQFNAEYGTNLRTWQAVYAVTDKAIKDARESL